MALKIVMRNISELKSPDYNPRQMSKQQDQDLEDSLEQFGYIDPAIINKNPDRLDIMVGGNQRTRKWGEMGHTQVPTVEVNLTEAEERELNIRLNKNTGGWDYELLAEHFKTDELLDWGWQDNELEFMTIDEQEPDADEDNFKIPNEIKTNIKLGDLIKIGDHRLVCGDSTKAKYVNKLLGKAKPNIMPTDPPYGVNYDPNWRNEAERANGEPIGASAVEPVTNDDQSQWNKAWALSPCNIAYIYHADKNSHLVAASIIDSGFELRNLIIWAKNNHVISRGHYHHKHEPCWYAVRKDCTADWIGDRSQTTLWEIDKPSKSVTGHSTQKPVECMAKPIKNHEGDVYDPFIGSGTTMVACEQLERKCYGMDIEPKNCQITIDRMLKLDPKIKVTINGKAYKKPKTK